MGRVGVVFMEGIFRDFFYRGIGVGLSRGVVFEVCEGFKSFYGIRMGEGVDFWL